MWARCLGSRGMREAVQKRAGFCRQSRRSRKPPYCGGDTPHCSVRGRRDCVAKAVLERRLLAQAEVRDGQHSKAESHRGGQERASRLRRERF
jgi:hypothetical protein